MVDASGDLSGRHAPTAWSLDRKIGVAAIVIWVLTLAAGLVQWGRITEKIDAVEKERSSLRGISNRRVKHRSPE